MPILLFHAAGFCVLVWLCFVFLHGGQEAPPCAWPALIAALAGMPYGLAARVKKLVDAVAQGAP